MLMALALLLVVISFATPLPLAVHILLPPVLLVVIACLNAARLHR